MSELRVPFDAVVDGPSRRKFARLLRQMLSGKLPPEGQPLSLDGLRGYALAAQTCLEAYAERGSAGVWRLMGPLAATNPTLAQALTDMPDAELPPTELTIYSATAMSELPPVTFLDQERMIQDKGITMIVGQPGTGKSLWMLGKLQEIAATMPVLLVAAEAQGGLPDRLKALSKALHQPLEPAFHVCPQAVSLRHSEDVTALVDDAKELGARLIAFDTWAACTAGVDENAVKDVTPIFGVLEHIKSAVGCAILLIHHTRKDGGAYRGSSAIHGALDNLYILAEDDGDIVLRAEKTRDVGKPDNRHYRIVEFETRKHPETGMTVHAPALLPAAQVVDEPDKPKRVVGNMRTVLEVLDAFDEGLPALTLRDATTLSNTTFYRTLKRLLEAEYVMKDAGQYQEAPYRITAAGREALR